MAVIGVRLIVALGILVLAGVGVGVGHARADTMPELARPARGRESTPLCSPECEVITAPTEAASGLEYEGAGPGGGFTPQELRAAYGLPEHGGAGVTVAVVDDVGDPGAGSGLATYRERFGLPPCTEAAGCFRQVDEHGEPSHPRESTSWAGEISLDLDMVSAACPECSILLVEGAGRAGRVEAIKTAVEMGAAVVTNSWNFGFEKGNPANAVACRSGGCVSEAEEREWDPKFDFPGVPILFSGGDYGYAVRYPADSPNVISVGGTRLLHEPEGDRGWKDEVWSNSTYGVDQKGRGTGSGCSISEPKPAWETDKSCKYHIENDVAADADPASPVAVYSDYWEEWVLDGGTSASTPFVAGVEAISSAPARELGAAAFWQAGEAGALNDVTVGSDGTCTPPTEDEYWCAAQTGYDGPTGWGTPDGPLSLAPGPTPTTDPPGTITATTAALRGHVDASGVSGSVTCSFQLASAAHPSFHPPLAEIPCSPTSVGAGQEAAVEGDATGLAPHTRYLYRVAAGNAETGLESSGTQAFETLPEPPRASTDPATTLTQTSARLHAQVDNEGAPAGTTCAFQVTTAADTAFAAPLATVPCEPALVEGEASEAVVGTISGLDPVTTYRFRVEATSSGGGPIFGSAATFATLPDAPTVVTGLPTSIGRNEATVEATVDNASAPRGSECTFRVATAADPHFDHPIATVPCSPAAVEGAGAARVEAVLTGLTPNTKDLYEVEAINEGGGPSVGAAESFTTLPNRPVVANESASAFERAAELAATIDAEGDPGGASCKFQLAASGDPDFESPLATLPCEPATVFGGEERRVEVMMKGLTPGTAYLYRAEASNRGGIAVGPTLRFTTEPVYVGGGGTVFISGPPPEKQAGQSAAEGPTTPPASGAEERAPTNRFSLGQAARRGAIVTVTVTVPGPGTISVSGGGSIRRTEAQAIAAGSITLRIPLGAATRRHAARDPKLRLTLLVSFAPSGGTATTKKLTVPIGRRAGGH